MMRRAVFLLAALLVGSAFAATTATAQSSSAPQGDDDYTALCSPLTVDNPSPQPGDTVTVGGTAATGGAQIAIVLLPDTLVPAAAGSSNPTTSDATTRAFSTQVVIPNDATPGS